MSTDLHTLSGAYAIDALSTDEAAAFRKHLDVCPACRQEVSELRAAAAQMGASEALAPPAQLRTRVLEAADRMPQLPPRVSSLEARRSRRWAPRLLTAAAALVLVVGAVLGVQQLQDDDPRLAAGVSAVFEAADSHQAEVETSHGPVRVATSQSEGEMAVDTSDLVPLDADHAYQVWSLVDGDPVPVVVLERPDAGAHMPMPEPGTQVAITVEPAGGSRLPTTEPIVQVDPSEV
jgi:anti-sigma-K factor RskA